MTTAGGDPGGLVPADEPLDVVYVEVLTGVVHRGICDRTRRDPPGGHVHWTPEMAGLDDRACPACLPHGLPGGSTRH